MRLIHVISNWQDLVTWDLYMLSATDRNSLHETYTRYQQLTGSRYMRLIHVISNWQDLATWDLYMLSATDRISLHETYTRYQQMTGSRYMRLIHVISNWQDLAAWDLYMVSATDRISLHKKSRPCTNSDRLLKARTSINSRNCRPYTNLVIGCSKLERVSAAANLGLVPILL